MAGSVGLWLLPAMLIPEAWQEMWAWHCCRPCWFSGHGGSC